VLITKHIMTLIKVLASKIELRIFLILHSYTFSDYGDYSSNYFTFSLGKANVTGVSSTEKIM